MLSSMEKYQKMLRLEPYNDRREMPVFPMLLASYGSLGDVSQKDIINNIDNWFVAIENTIKVIGKPDVSMPTCPSDVIFTMSLPARIPGRELADNDLYQFVETPYFEDESEYSRIFEMGWQNWFGEYVMKIQKPPMTNPEQLFQRYQQVGANLSKTIKYLYSHDIVPCFDLAIYPIFDSISLIRSMAEFTCDLYDDPDKIMKIVNKYQPIQDDDNIKMLKATGGTRIGNYAMRSSSTFISPTMFKDLVWPSLKDSINRYWKAGITTVLHADANWLPMLEYFTELPKGCCHIELDGATDIFKAYEILQGSQSIRGDVPSTLFAFGTPDEVSEYCEKLIKMGMKGGFMLSSGCEVPLNAKAECVKAMMDSVK